MGKTFILNMFLNDSTLFDRHKKECEQEKIHTSYKLSF